MKEVMKIAIWDPFREFARMEREIRRMFVVRDKEHRNGRNFKARGG